MPIEIEKEMEKIHRQIKHLIDTFSQQMMSIPTFSEQSWIPNMDVVETENELIVIIDAAGLNKKDFNITLEGDILSIFGYREEHFQVRDRKYHQVEIHYGPFERKYRLPVSVRTDAISATYKNGFLEIKLPKKKVTVSRIIESKE